jgi:hypothetical protein
MTTYKKHTFVHITKTGGTAVEKYINEHYSDYIVGRGHKLMCTNSNNPIVIIRNPFDRFISMYNYWKNGATSGDFTISEEATVNKNKTIKEFIHIMKNETEKLNTSFTWYDHFLPQSKWIPKSTYKNVIVIVYASNLEDKIFNLLDYLGIENKYIPLDRVNVSIKELNEDLEMEDVQFIASQYKEDIELWNLIRNEPNQFKHVL